jgi:small subunit ribosomal protein S2
VAIKVSAEELLERGAHFGHQVRRWNPKMKNYIYGEDGGVHLFDLIKTKKALEEVLEILRKASKEGKKIVFVGTKKQAKDLVADIAKNTGSFFVNERWLGGTLTNFPQIKKSLKKLEKLREDKESGAFSEYTKRERLLIDREIERLERFFGGLKGMEELPDFLVVVDAKKEKGACLEAKMKGVRVIGIVDTNSDPELVDWVVPMNDDATKALEYVFGLMQDALLDGKKKTAKSEGMKQI